MIVWEHETTRSTGVAYLSWRTMIRVGDTIATVSQYAKRNGIATSTIRQRWEDNWPAWEVVSRPVMRAGQKRPGYVQCKPSSPAIDHRVDMHIHRVDFFALPKIVGPHLAAWNGKSWDVVELPDGDCGVHEGNGPHCLKCAATALWAKQQPTPYRGHGKLVPNKEWLHRRVAAPRVIAPFPKASGG